MPPEEFAREFMVWWDVEDEGPPPALDLTAWASRLDRTVSMPDRAGVYLDVSPDRRSSTIGVAGDTDGGKHLVMVRTKAGVDWIVPELVKLQTKRDIAEVALYPGSQTAALIPALRTAGVEFTTVTAGWLGQAWAQFKTAVEDGALVHAGQPELDAAIGNARTRWVDEVERLDRRDRAVDISPAVAVVGALAVWAKYSVDDYDIDDSIL